MKLIRNIGAIVMIAIFLIPATGFYFTRHSCHKTGEVQFVLDEDYSCCAITAELPVDVKTSSASACCNTKTGNTSRGLPVIKDRDENCCLNEGKYLKSKEKYSIPDKAKLPHIEISITIATILASPVPAWNPSIEQNAHSPPPPISSKNILLRNGVMLI